MGVSELTGMPVLIYWKSLGAKDGTTIQLNRLLAGQAHRFVHYWWEDEAEAAAPAIPRSVHLPEHASWVTRTNGRLRRALHRLWPGSFFAPRRFTRRRQVRKTSGGRAALAYVVVYNSAQSANALDLLSALGDPPYVVHLMDLMDHAPLFREAHGRLIDLCAGAREVICISDPLAREIGRFTPAPPRVLTISADPLLQTFVPDAGKKRPFRIALSGTIYPGRYTDTRLLSFLAEIWPEFHATFPEAELVYAGNSFAAFPGALQPWVTNLGPLPPPEHMTQLAQCSVAGMNASYAPESIFRFSLPSRIADFMAAGLPLISTRATGTALAEFLARREGRGVTIVDSAPALRSVLAAYLQNHDRLVADSQSVHQFARENFSAQELSRALFRWLDATGAAEQARSSARSPAS